MATYANLITATILPNQPVSSSDLINNFTQIKNAIVSGTLDICTKTITIVTSTNATASQIYAWNGTDTSDWLVGRYTPSDNKIALWNYKDAAIEFATNNSIKWTITNGGSLESPSGKRGFFVTDGTSPGGEAVYRIAGAFCATGTGLYSYGSKMTIEATASGPQTTTAVHHWKFKVYTEADSYATGTDLLILNQDYATFTGYVKPLGGYQSADTTAGATATNVAQTGMNFKNGLFVGVS